MLSLIHISIGSVDFAGGNVVHISSGVSALVLAIYLGRRRGYEKTSYRIHNIPFVVLGAALLWFGWYGFNAGSALAADGLAAHAFMKMCIRDSLYKELDDIYHEIALAIGISDSALAVLYVCLLYTSRCV